MNNKAVFTNKFKKQYHLAIKRGLKTTDIDTVLSAIVKGEKLEVKYRDHILIGNFSGCRECHIKNDYLLIYRYEKDSVIFELLGTHSDLFS